MDYDRLVSIYKVANLALTHKALEAESERESLRRTGDSPREIVGYILTQAADRLGQKGI